MSRFLALLLTVLTGMTGLVYEVTWQKYLATLLGSHSEATSAVLGIFLAGMSLGYAAFGRLSRRLVRGGPAATAGRRLLLAYGLAEAAIGAFALAFPSYFGVVQGLSGRLPEVATGVGFALDVGLAAALIGVPAVLMGGTIPMLTQALSRDLEDASHLHAYVYALNTAGACGGALAAAYLLIPALGLAGVMSAMGAVNLAAGASFVALAGRQGGVAGPAAGATGGVAGPAAGATGGGRGEAGPWVAVAGLVGFAMMAIQTVLNRLGGLSLGSSEFTFATVVAVFVLCIALGSLAVARLRRVPRRALAWNQWLLFASFAALYGVLDQGPYWLHVVRTAFGSSDADFYAYYLSGFGVMLAVVGLPIMLSGATLPLLFHQLREQAGDLGALAGRIYAWNTVGSLAGALLGGYVLLFWLDLHHVYLVAVVALGAAALLTSCLLGALSDVRALGAGLVLVAVAGLLPPWSQTLLASGLFRMREPIELTYAGPAAAEKAGFRGAGGRIIFYDDDPAISATVLEQEGEPLVRSILSNGKSDSSTGTDRLTTAMLAIVPVLIAGDPENAFVIGLGTGVTAGELAQVESMRRVRVAEISEGVIRAAPLFDFANMGVSENEKIEVVRSDAHRALLRSRERWDVIVSEPSNAWMTGVEMLYSYEFLQVARERLSPDGVFVQWMHVYEIDDAGIELVLRTYTAAFDRVAVWIGLGDDLLLVGLNEGHPGYDLESVRARAERPDLQQALERAGIRDFASLLVHELAPLGVVNELVLEGPLHTLHHPRLSHAAGRSFFRADRGRLPFLGSGRAARLAEERSLLREHLRRLGRPPTDSERGPFTAQACTQRPLCTALLAQWFRDDPQSRALERMIYLLQRPGFVFHESAALNPFREVSQLLEGDPPRVYFDPEKLTDYYEAYYHPQVPFDPEALLRAWEQCGPPERSVEECERGTQRARALLEGGA